MVAALITPMTVLHQQHNGDLQAMKDKFAVASKGIVFKIKVCCIQTQCCCNLRPDNTAVCVRTRTTSPTSTLTSS